MNIAPLSELDNEPRLNGKAEVDSEESSDLPNELSDGSTEVVWMGESPFQGMAEVMPPDPSPADPGENNPANEPLPDLTATSETFQVVDGASANWVVRRILEARAYARRVQAWSQAEVHRAEREEEFFWWKFGAGLEKWAAESVAQIKGRQGRKNSLTLPSGMIGFRARRPHLKITDEAALVEWSQRHCPQAVRMELVVSERNEEKLQERIEVCATDLLAGSDEFRVKVLRSVLQKHLEATGEMPDGCELEPMPAKLYIR